MKVTFADGFELEYHGAGCHAYVGDGKPEGTTVFLEGEEVPPETARLFAEMGKALDAYRGRIVSSLG